MKIHNMSEVNPKFKRQLKLAWSLNPNTGSAALILRGARQAGKTTFLHVRFPAARFYDPLDTSLAAELSLRPRLLREQVLAEAPERRCTGARVTRNPTLLTRQPNVPQIWLRCLHAT